LAVIKLNKKYVVMKLFSFLTTVCQLAAQ
jgi:hypothetical protein